MAAIARHLLVDRVTLILVTVYIRGLWTMEVMNPWKDALVSRQSCQRAGPRSLESKQNSNAQRLRDHPWTFHARHLRPHSPQAVWDDFFLCFSRIERVPRSFETPKQHTMYNMPCSSPTYRRQDARGSLAT